MTIEITRPGKYSISLTTPVMPAAGTMGFGDAYNKFIKLEKLGALVTNPVTYEQRSPASGTRIIPIDAGVLVHTGLPNPGLSKTLRAYGELWKKMDIPVILHLVATRADHVRKAVGRIGSDTAVAGIELGIGDDAEPGDVEVLVDMAVKNTERPILVRLPLMSARELARMAVDAGAAALVVGAPPRGTARDSLSGQLVTGRIYGPLIKPIALRTVADVRQQVKSNVPIIGAGGIHSFDDARDFLEAGAIAVQVDSVIWLQPRLLERIARDLGGWLRTRPTGAFPDEWNADMGDTEFEKLFGAADEDSEPSEPSDVG